MLITKLSRCILGRATASIMIGAFTWVTAIFPAIAEDVVTPPQIAIDGKVFAQDIMPSGPLFSYSQGDGSAYFQTGDSTTELNVDDIFPGGTAGSSSDMSKYYTDRNALYSAGQTRANELKEEEGSWGDAYRTLTGSLALSRPNLDNDPIFSQTDTALENLEVLQKAFGECKTEQTYEEVTIEKHVPDLKTCERINSPSGACDVVHDYTAGIIQHVSGPYNLQSCGPGCTYLWIGTVGDNYWLGSCKIYEENIVVKVLEKEAIQNVVVEYAKWDDYMQIILNGDKVWAGPNDNFPPETAGQCELMTSWSSSPNVDVTSYFKTDSNVSFKTRTSVSGAGEGYARLRIEYDPKVPIRDNGWQPSECAQAVQAIDDGFCTGTYSCIDAPSSVEGCTTINGVRVCEDQLENLSNGISNLCRKVRVSALDCGFWKGQMSCWEDPQGNTVCPYNDGEVTDSCKTFEENPTCGFVSSRCVEGAKGESGECYVNEETWDCGYDVSIPTLQANSTNDCVGSIACMGESCVQQERTTSTDFATAAASLQAANFMGMDTDCDTVDINANNECRVFGGEAYTCKKAVGGIVDCCSGAPGGVGLFGYLQLIMAVGKLDSAIMGMEGVAGLDAAVGAWSELRAPVMDTYTTISEGLVEGWETITGTTTELAGEAAQEGILAAMQTEMTNAVAEWTAEIFGEAARDALFSVGEGGNFMLGGGEALLGTALSWIMLAYTIYSITKLLIQIIWQCEQREFELQSKRDLKSCHHVGSYCASKFVGMCLEKRESYCCFASPISRIIQEEVRDQKGIGWGDVENPDCSPFSTTFLDTVDWDQIDLSEWTAMLYQYDFIPSADEVNIDRLTGSGSFLNQDGSRDDAAERALERINGLDATDIRTDAVSGVPINN